MNSNEDDDGGSKENESSNQSLDESLKVMESTIMIFKLL